MPHILTLNAGSSSIKFAVYALPGQGGEEPQLKARGLVEGIGSAPRLKEKAADGALIADRLLDPDADHAHALTAALESLAGAIAGMRIVAVGHRVVHGGSRFVAPILLDEAVMVALAAYTPFAPSHQPHNLKGVMAAREAFPDALQVACFDTAFHQGKAFAQDTYGLPRELYAQGVRRYGHHGLSYDYIAGALHKVAPEVADGKVVIAHLGNGASMCAIHRGRSVESTMGFSALDGLPMGSRCGQLDPGILLYLMLVKGMNVVDIEAMLYKQSGLKGLSGLTNDMRVLEAAATAEAEQAIDYFTAMVRREIGAMATTLGGLDAVVFCGGIGENAAGVRERVIAPLAWLGLELDAPANAAGQTRISAAGSRIPVYVIPTDEEIVIARACLSFVGEPATA